MSKPELLRYRRNAQYEHFVAVRPVGNGRRDQVGGAPSAATSPAGRQPDLRVGPDHPQGGRTVRAGRAQAGVGRVEALGGHPAEGAG